MKSITLIIHKTNMKIWIERIEYIKKRTKKYGYKKFKKMKKNTLKSH